MREYTLRTDGLCNTITTVQKDNYIAVGAAMRGRYNSECKTQQQIEVRDMSCLIQLQRFRKIV